MDDENSGKYSIMGYLDIEQQSDVKMEYDNGAIIAMSGSTLNHGIIGNNINTEINNALKSRDRKCVSINGDVRSCLNLTLRAENAPFSLILRYRNTHYAMA